MIFEQIEHLKDVVMAAASTPVVPKSILANLVEKAAIVAVGAGLALWVSDQRQADAIANQSVALQRIEQKVDTLEREGSRPVVEMKAGFQARFEAIDSRLKLIESRLENKR